MSFDIGAPAYWFVEIFLDDEIIRVCNSFENISFGGVNYTGIGDRLSGPSKIRRSADLRSQKFKLEFDSSRQLSNEDAVAKLLDSNFKRRPIRARFAVGGLNESFVSPHIIADEVGRIENVVDELKAGESRRAMIEIESGALVFLERRNQTRTPANQKAIFPDDRFFDYTARLNGVVLPWSTKRKRQGRVRISYNIEGVSSRELLIGRGVTPGSFVYGATHGPNGQRTWWSQVYALADHQCERLEQVIINGEDVLRGQVLSHGVRTAINHPSFDGNSGIRLWVTWYDGRPAQSADSYLISETAGQPFAWTAEHRGRGVSYVIITHRYDSDLADNFSYRFILRGARLYDERRDSTVGGAGGHRLNDPESWEYSTNAEVALRHFLLGRRIDASSRSWFGVGADRSFLDSHSLFALRATHCDGLFSLKNGGTQKRYECNGWISAADDHKKNATKIADAMAAQIFDQAGKLAVRLSEPQESVVELFDDDLVESQPSDVSINARADDVVNRVEGRFIDASNGFAAADYPPQSNALALAEDGQEITGTWNQDLEIDATRAQRKALLRLNRLRRTFESTETFGAKAAIIKPGDWFTRKSVARGFPSGKIFIADDLTRNANGTVTITQLEVDPNEKPWVVEDAVDVLPAGVFDFPPVRVPAPGLTATGGQLNGASGVVLPTGEIAINWSPSAAVMQTEIELAASDAGLPVEPFRTINVPAGRENIVFYSLEPGRLYLVRIRAIEDGVAGDWSEWEPFETPDVFAAKSAYLDGDGGNIATQFQAVDVRFADVDGEIATRTTFQDVLDVESAASSARGQLQTSVTAQIETAEINAVGAAKTYTDVQIVQESAVRAAEISTVRASIVQPNLIALPYQFMLAGQPPPLSFSYADVGTPTGVINPHTGDQALAIQHTSSSKTANVTRFFLAGQSQSMRLEPGFVGVRLSFRHDATYSSFLLRLADETGAVFATIGPFGALQNTDREITGVFDLTSLTAPVTASLQLVSYLSSGVVGSRLWLHAARIEKVGGPTDAVGPIVRDEATAIVSAIKHAFIDPSTGDVRTIHAIELNSNGHVSSLRGFNDGSTSEWVFDTDALKVYNGSSANPVFQVSGGNVFLNGQVVRTDNIKDDSITKTSSIEVAGPVNITSGAGFVELASTSLTTTGGRVSIKTQPSFKLKTLQNPSGLPTPIVSAKFRARIKRNGQVIRHLTLSGALTHTEFSSAPDTGWLNQVSPANVDLDTPPAGNHTYSLEVEAGNAAGPRGFVASAFEIFLEAMEIKK